MLDLNAIENSIAQRIRQPLLDLGFAVEVFPGNVDEFYKPVTKGRCFVGLRQIVSQAPQGLNPRGHVLQEDTLRIQLVYKSQDLRGHTAPLAAIPQVRELLTGFSPPNCSPFSLHQRDVGFVEVARDLWLYSQIFELPFKSSIRPGA